MKYAEAHGVPAIGMSDQDNVFALVKFYKEAQKHGIKPIIGADLRLRDPDSEQSHYFTLLCCDVTGYRNLSALITRSYQEGQQRGVPMVEAAWLDSNTDGLIALSGAAQGELGRALAAERNAAAVVAAWQRRFPDRFYVELQRTGREGEEQYLHLPAAKACHWLRPMTCGSCIVRILKLMRRVSAFRLDGL